MLEAVGEQLHATASLQPAKIPLSIYRRLRYWNTESSRILRACKPYRTWVVIIGSDGCPVISGLATARVNSIFLIIDKLAKRKAQSLRVMPCHYGSQDSSVHIVTGLLHGRSGVRFPAETKDFFFLSKRSRATLGCIPLNAGRGSSPGARRPERKVEIWPPSSARLKNAWS